VIKSFYQITFLIENDFFILKHFYRIKFRRKPFIRFLIFYLRNEMLMRKLVGDALGQWIAGQVAKSPVCTGVR
jgi:hypothetical protein